MKFHALRACEIKRRIKRHVLQFFSPDHADRRDPIKLPGGGGCRDVIGKSTSEGQNGQPRLFGGRNVELEFSEFVSRNKRMQEILPP